MGKKAQFILPMLNSRFDKCKTVEFDDLETFEHTNCKPLSVILMTEFGTRRILGFRVAQMPCKGTLAALSRKKYGKRKDHRGPARKELFEELKDYIEADALIKSDENPHYTKDVKAHFPEAQHKVFKGRGARNGGQGELKKGGFDPLFTLNHTCAMWRANINRLVRKTWCTTKRPERLGYHIALYSLFHNEKLLKLKQKDAANTVMPSN